MNSNKVLIVDPITALRKYAGELAAEAYGADVEILHAIDGRSALKIATEHKPSLVITEMSLPDISAIELAQRIWSLDSGIKILFWTQHHRSIYMRDLGSIASSDSIYGYVLKAVREDKLLYAITSLWLHDNPYIDPQVRQQMNVDKLAGRLSDREFEVLKDIALGLTEKAIARRRNLTIRGVQSRTAAIYSKLNINGEMEDYFSRRALLLSEVVRTGLVEAQSLSAWKADLEQWLMTEAQGTYAQ
jgi:DNA-binding NarL/FixJ family response regulator